MPKQKTKLTAVETVRDWIDRHRDENLDLKALAAAATAFDRRSEETQSAAARLGEALEARQEALILLKAALKTAKTARKAVSKKG